MKIQVIGFGIIGQGFARVIHGKKEELIKRHGLDVQIVSISDITGTAVDEKGLDLKKALEVMDKKREIINYPGARKINGIQAIETLEADAVIEVTPSNIKTGEPGISHMLKAMECGKHVITSNKAPLVLNYRKLVETAGKNNVIFRFEASVGGAMPIINFARDALAGDRIKSIEGILNGTTNYILTRMAKEGSSFHEVLKEAQELGIAETDPTYDIDGIDTASKLVILANSIMGMDIKYDDVKTRGIRRITPEAIELAKKDRFVIKLVGEIMENHLEVAPRLVPVNHPLNVEGVLNVATFRCDIAGDITVVGKGAGSIETNSAILSDLINLNKAIR